MKALFASLALVALSAPALAADSARPFTGRFKVDAPNCDSNLEGADRVYVSVERKTLMITAFADDSWGSSIMLGQGTTPSERSTYSWKTTIRGNVLSSVETTVHPALGRKATVKTRIVSHGDRDDGSLEITVEEKRGDRPAEKTSCRLYRY